MKHSLTSFGFRHCVYKRNCNRVDFAFRVEDVTYLLTEERLRACTVRVQYVLVMYRTVRDASTPTRQMP